MFAALTSLHEVSGRTSTEDSILREYSWRIAEYNETQTRQEKAQTWSRLPLSSCREQEEWWATMQDRAISKFSSRPEADHRPERQATGIMQTNQSLVPHDSPTSSLSPVLEQTQAGSQPAVEPQTNTTPPEEFLTSSSQARETFNRLPEQPLGLAHAPHPQNTTSKVQSSRAVERLSPTQQRKYF